MHIPNIISYNMLQKLKLVIQSNKIKWFYLEGKMRKDENWVQLELQSCSND